MKTINNTTTGKTTFTRKLTAFSTQDKDVITKFLDYLESKKITLESIKAGEVAPERKDIDRIVVLDGPDGTPLDYIALDINGELGEVFCVMTSATTKNFKEHMKKLFEITFKDITVFGGQND